MFGLGLNIGVGSPKVRGGAFSITDVSNLQLWLAFNKGQGAIESGLQWSDSSGNSNNARQTNNDHEGAFSGGAYRTDAGANDHLEFTSLINLTGAYHVFMAIDLSEQTNETFLSSTNSSTSFMRLGQGSSTNLRLRQNTASNQDDITMSVAFGTNLALIEILRDSSNDVRVIRNGTQVGTSSSQAGTFEAGQISAHSNGLSSANIHEVVIFSSSLSSGDATNVRNDIISRCSISI